MINCSATYNAWFLYLCCKNKSFIMYHFWHNIMFASTLQPDTTIRDQMHQNSNKIKQFTNNNSASENMSTTTWNNHTSGYVVESKMTAVKPGEHLQSVRMKCHTHCRAVGLVTNVCQWLTQTARPRLQQTSLSASSSLLFHVSDVPSCKQELLHEQFKPLALPGATMNQTWNTV